jgi:hypothetical protein
VAPDTPATIPNTAASPSLAPYIAAECHALLESPSMGTLRLRHPAQDVGLSCGHAARDQLVHLARDDLTLPGLQQSIPDLVGNHLQDPDL